MADGFEPDLRSLELSGLQVDEEGPGAVGLEPALKLWMAVLERAILDACGTTSECRTQWRGQRREGALRCQAQGWIFSPSEKTFSCQWVCDALDVDIERVRRFVSRNIDSLFRAPLEQSKLPYGTIVSKLIMGER